MIIRTLLLAVILGCATGCTEQADHPLPSESEPHAVEGSSDVAADDLIFDPPEKADEPLARWTALTNNGGRARFSIAEDGASPQSQALKVEIVTLGQSDQWDIQVLRENVPVKPHAIYNYSAWVKGPRGAQVNMGVEGADYLAVANKDAILTGRWQQVAFEFQPEQSVVRTPIHFSFPHNDNAIIHVDDVRLEISN